MWGSSMPWLPILSMLHFSDKPPHQPGYALPSHKLLQSVPLPDLFTHTVQYKMVLCYVGVVADGKLLVVGKRGKEARLVNT